MLQVWLGDSWQPLDTQERGSVRISLGAGLCGRVVLAGAETNEVTPAAALLNAPTPSPGPAVGSVQGERHVHGLLILTLRGQLAL